MDDLGMDHYSIRLTIDHNDASIEKLTTFVKKYRVFLVTGHSDKSESPHYHLYVKTSLKNQALRKRIKVSFPECIGNKGYSIKKLDELRLDEHLRYLCRDEEPGVVMSTFNEETIQEYHDDYYQQQKEFKLKVKTISKGISFEIIKFIEDNPDIIEPNNPQNCEVLGREQKKIRAYEPHEIAVFVFEYYIRNKNMLPSKWIFKSMVDTVYMRCSSENDYKARRNNIISDYLDY